MFGKALVNALMYLPCFQVAKHLTKLFDSMSMLKFKEDDKGNNTKIALGMHSKDGEYVDLDQECDLGGQVYMEFILSRYHVTVVLNEKLKVIFFNLFIFKLS